MTNKINFLKINIDSNDKDFIGVINEISTNHKDICTVYTNQYGINNINKNFSIISTQYAKYAKGIMFCWDILSVDLAIQLPGPSKVIFYMTELYWMQNPNNHYKSWYNIFKCPKIHIIVDSEEYQDILRLSWQVKSDVIKSSEDIYNAI